MDKVNVIPGLITVTLFAVIGLVLAWLSHRGNGKDDPRKRKP